MRESLACRKLFVLEAALLYIKSASLTYSSIDKKRTKWKKKNHPRWILTETFSWSRIFHKLSKQFHRLCVFSGELQIALNKASCAIFKTGSEALGENYMSRQRDVNENNVPLLSFYYIYLSLCNHTIAVSTPFRLFFQNGHVCRAPARARRHKETVNYIHLTASSWFSLPFLPIMCSFVSSSVPTCNYFF